MTQRSRSLAASGVPRTMVPAAIMPTGLNRSRTNDTASRKARSYLSGSFGKLQTCFMALPADPPIPISAIPHPEARKAPDSSIPAFPVSVDGFRDEDPAGVTSRAKINEVFLTRLYALVAARDSEGLRKHTEQ